MKGNARATHPAKGNNKVDRARARAVSADPPLFRLARVSSPLTFGLSRRRARPQPVRPSERFRVSRVCPCALGGVSTPASGWPDNEQAQPHSYKTASSVLFSLPLNHYSSFTDYLSLYPPLLSTSLLHHGRLLCHLHPLHCLRRRGDHGPDRRGQEADRYLRILLRRSLDTSHPNHPQRES
jgi:hypothetical protein